jgi:hypothetical protein
MPSSPVGSAYRPRDAAASPLYRAILASLETYLAERSRQRDTVASPCAESSLRAFLECGIPRFGVARFRCKDCGDSRFVPFSCKRRMACPSCDAKRAVVESGHALEELLAAAPYRQWVLVLPKRLRYFVHRDARLPGEISRLLAETLTDFHLRRAAAPKDAAPAQFHVLQRFGSSVNLHLHDHAVVSDGVFRLDNGVLHFSTAPPPTFEEVTQLVEGLRRRILKRMQRLKVLPEAVVGEMLAWPHGGFSLDGGTFVEAHDRAGLERLLLYVLRPALSLKALTYKPERDLVIYRPAKGKPDSPTVLEWSGSEFVGRIAALIPPARKHLVHYYGALGPRSPLRRAVSQAARQKAGAVELEVGYSVTVLGKVERAARKAIRAAARAWAVCLKRVFEVSPVLCVRCGGEMKLMGVILDDAELDRILAHQGWLGDFPKTKPARSPPDCASDIDGASQADPRTEQWDGRQDWPAGDTPA